MFIADWLINFNKRRVEAGEKDVYFSSSLTRHALLHSSQLTLNGGDVFQSQAAHSTECTRWPTLSISTRT